MKTKSNFKRNRNNFLYFFSLFIWIGGGVLIFSFEIFKISQAFAFVSWGAFLFVLLYDGVEIYRNPFEKPKKSKILTKIVKHIGLVFALTLYLLGTALVIINFKNFFVGGVSLFITVGPGIIIFLLGKNIGENIAEEKEKKANVCRQRNT